MCKKHKPLPTWLDSWFRKVLGECFSCYLEKEGQWIP